MKKIMKFVSIMTAFIALTSCSAKGSEAASSQAASDAPYRKDEIIALRQGKDIGFKEDVIGGSEITQECDQKGTITKVEYETKPYAMTAEQGDYNNYPVTKGMNVYTPYGYDADGEEKYDVLILCHGSGENEDYWFAQGDYDPTDSISTYLKGYGTHQVLDNMIKQGLSKRLIVVTPSLYTNVEGFETFKTAAYFALELKNDILPYLITHYNTYAEGTSEEQMIAARDHFAYAGLSYGGSVSYSAIWAQSLRYFSYIGSLSSSLSGDSYDLVKNAVVENKDTYGVKFWYSCMGLIDANMKSSVDGYLKLAEEAPEGYFKFGSDVSIGCNADYVLVNKTGHSYACWLTCLYNMLLVFFH